MIYNPSNWYWTVAGDQSRAYSSSVGDYVPANDAAFLAWKAGGNAPTRISSAAELGAVLGPLQLRPTDATILDAYKDKQAGDIVVAAIFKILFNHENRLRAIERALSLNGSPPALTQNQAKAAVKALM